MRFIDLTRILPKNLPIGNTVILKELNNGLVEFSIKRDGKITRFKPIIIKRLIPICEELFQLFGLWFGDGIKQKCGVHQTFGLANTELNLHKLFLVLTKKLFSIEPRAFRCFLKVPVRMGNNIDEIKRNLSDELNIPIENFRKPQLKENINLVCLSTVIDSRLLAFTIQLLFKKMRKILIKDKIFTSNFLSGLIATEGCIVVRKWGRLDEITIGAKKENERKFIRKLLLNLGIFPGKDKGKGQEAVAIHGLSNFKLFQKWDLVLLHPLKHKKFKNGIKGFKREEFRKGEGRFFILKSLSQHSKNRQELVSLLNRSSRSICEVDLILLAKLGLVKKNKLGNKIVSWSITRRGLEILELKNPLELLKKKSLLLNSVKLHRNVFEIFKGERKKGTNFELNII